MTRRTPMRVCGILSEIKMSRNTSLCLLVCVVGVFVALYGRSTFTDPRLEPARASLLVLEANNKVSESLRVALGYGACHDLFAEATALLESDRLKGTPQPYNYIATEEQLLRSFAYYFKHGAAAERFVSNTDLFEKLVSRAKSLNSRFALGGNAPLMAKRFFIEGWAVLLAAKMSKNLKGYIPKDIEVVGEEATQKDDVHMILEYKANEQWGPYTAPRANRFIVHNDVNNPMISTLEQFNERLPSYKPHLLVISGLQMMDNIPFKEGVRESRLNLIKEQMLAQPSSTLIHFEMASYIEFELLKLLTDLVIPNADSVGMNEQELTNLENVLLYGNVSYVSDSNPRVAIALDQMRRVFTLIRKTSTQLNRRTLLSRMHVHTLAYQAIMTVKDSKWKRTQAAAAKAALTAHRYVCNTDDVNLDRAKLVLDDSFATTAEVDNSRVFFDPSHAVSCWDEKVDGADVEICVAPVLVCMDAQLTAGAGDNISAAGLVLQV